MKKFFLFAFATILALAGCCKQEQKQTAELDQPMSIITETEINQVVETVKTANPDVDVDRLTAGVRCASKFWFAQDGSKQDFVNFCVENFEPTAEGRAKLLSTIERNFQAVYGRYNQISIDLKEALHLVGEPITPIDETFGAFDPFAHFNDDMFNSKIAFTVLLNFPLTTLEQKNTEGKNWTRQQWAEARLADWFSARVPAALLQNYSQKLTDADNYISNYNIIMGNLRNDKGEKIFPDNMALITHWGLRDELKSNYANADGRGFEKQQMIYQVMNRIIDQSIPANVISNENYLWNPYSNTVTDLEGKPVESEREADVRYQTLLDNFKASVLLDPYYPASPTAIKRAFDGQMEVSDAEIEEMFIKFISSAEVAEVAKIIEKRLGRKLEPFDIWYDGFKARSSVNEEDLSKITRGLYPTTEAFKADLPNIMIKFGFTPEKAAEVCSKVVVDASRGAGHAWGAMAKYDLSHLRTRVAADGMDYKGYCIATHEFGHNVEQTITMNDVDNYFMSGVPSTAFTEALAFVFQKRDLSLLGITNNDPNAAAMTTLDIFWGCYEIMGVSLVDIYTWRWMYEHPEATAAELKEAVMNNAVEVWNKYYAPVFGVENSPILGIYSHMIDNPLYLSNYPYGHIVESQIETKFEGNNLGTEVCRMYPVGRLTPNLWMQHAVGSNVSVDPLLNEVKIAIEKLK
ncbi:MAG: hypothetical protein KIG42_02055 [Paludibacteraceae bacterium]|nr:hypothetical protein [Paludibacteraceae bacterium]